LRSAHGSILARIKGLINVVEHEQPFVSMVVSRVLSGRERNAGRPAIGARDVFITRDMDEAPVRRTSRRC